MALLLVVYIIIGFLLACVALIYITLVRPQKHVYDVFKVQGIPGEPFIPVIGQLPNMLRASKMGKGVDYFDDLAHKHGYRYLVGVGPLIRLVLLEPDLIADFLGRSKCENYRKPNDLTLIVKPLAGVHNLLVSEGEEHHRARKMLNPAFHFLKLRSMIPIMVNETAKAIDSILSMSSVSDRIDVETQFSALTLSIIASSAFGQGLETIPHAKEIICQSFNNAKDVIEYRALRLIGLVQFLADLPFWGKKTIDEAAKKLNEFVDQAITDRRNGKSKSLCSGEDILDLLLSAVDENHKGFSDQQIREEALTFVLAGHETTATLMAWTIYVLMTHEQVLHACREEVDRVLPNGTMPDFEHMADLSVIEAVIYETLRLYPPAPFFARECIKEHTLVSSDGKLEMHVPVGAMILVHNYSLHRREEYWPRPLEFDYTRWMRDSISGLKPKLPHPFAFLPFAAGSRNCIGQNFAILEAKIILAMFVQRCEFILLPDQHITPEMKGVTIKAKYGLFAHIKQRHN
ncbi:unnamed protein product [Rotaria sp. Silwood2]|nr:unnamed protein product [Rotaria sp. Silwood2]CAF4257983.1 unnamed protein product [Rotaria sp. Silwood2]